MPTLSSSLPLRARLSERRLESSAISVAFPAAPFLAPLSSASNASTCGVALAQETVMWQHLG